MEIQGANFKIGDILIVDIESTEITFGKIEKIIQSDKGISFTFKLYKEDYVDDDLNGAPATERKSDRMQRTKYFPRRGATVLSFFPV